MKRTLSLKRETVTELLNDELTGVVGGAPPTTPVNECLDKFFETLQATRCFCP